MQQFPLYWPDGHPRSNERKDSQFKTSLPAALSNVRKSLEMFSNDSRKKVEDIIISSNVTLGTENPKEAGVALWFKWDSNQFCIAVDRYSKVQDNLQAIHHILEARRTELRHGGLQIVKQTFMGFKALTGGAPPRKWWEVLGVNQNADRETIKNAYRAKSMVLHPDKGGSAEEFNELNKAYKEAEL